MVRLRSKSGRHEMPRGSVVGRQSPYERTLQPASVGSKIRSGAQNPAEMVSSSPFFVDKGGRCWYNQIILGKAGICGNDVDSRLIFGMNVKRLPEWG